MAFDQLNKVGNFISIQKTKIYFKKKKLIFALRIHRSEFKIN